MTGDRRERMQRDHGIEAEPRPDPEASACWTQNAALESGAFDDDIGQLHWRFDADTVEDIYVVGDVHGCLAELRTLWNRLDPGPDDMVVFVGDLVRKGPASVEVVEFVHEQDNAVSVRGNNEAKILTGRVGTEPFAPVVETIETFPLVVSWDDAVAVHGGLDPRKALEAHTREDLLELRSVPRGNSYDGPFWFDQYDGPERVFFGHTVLEEPIVRDSVVGLDTGCVYGGALTAYDYRRDELLQVPAERTHRSRPDEKFL
jgi:serine/threonine protein phosphatase 1